MYLLFSVHQYKIWMNKDIFGFKYTWDECGVWILTWLPRTVERVGRWFFRIENHFHAVGLFFVDWWLAFNYSLVWHWISIRIYSSPQIDSAITRINWRPLYRYICITNKCKVHWSKSHRYFRTHIRNQPCLQQQKHNTKKKKKNLTIWNYIQFYCKWNSLMLNHQQFVFYSFSMLRRTK